MQKLWEQIYNEGFWTEDQARSIAYRIEWHGMTQEAAEAQELAETGSALVRSEVINGHSLHLATDGTVTVQRAGNPEPLVLAPDVAEALRQFLRSASSGRQGGAGGPGNDPFLDVLPLIASGLNDREIALRLGLTMREVRAHITDMLHTLGLEYRYDLACYALRRGLVRAEDMAPPPDSQ